MSQASRQQTAILSNFDNLFTKLAHTKQSWSQRSHVTLDVTPDCHVTLDVTPDCCPHPVSVVVGVSGPDGAPGGGGGATPCQGESRPAAAGAAQGETAGHGGPPHHLLVDGDLPAGVGTLRGVHTDTDGRDLCLLRHVLQVSTCQVTIAKIVG